MNFSFAKDQSVFSEAVEALRGKEHLIEENIKAKYDEIADERRKAGIPVKGDKPEKKEVAPEGETQVQPEEDKKEEKPKRTRKSK